MTVNNWGFGGDGQAREVTIKDPVAQDMRTRRVNNVHSLFVQMSMTLVLGGSVFAATEQPSALMLKFPGRKLWEAGVGLQDASVPGGLGAMARPSAVQSTHSEGVGLVF